MRPSLNTALVGDRILLKDEDVGERMSPLSMMLPEAVPKTSSVAGLMVLDVGAE